MAYIEILEDSFEMVPVYGIKDHLRKKISNGTEVFITPHIKITDSAGVGKILTSDEDGNASWQTNSLSQFAATTSAQLRGVLSDENGTGVALFDNSTSANFITPILGVAAATSINKVTLTAPATGSTLTIADGKTLTVNNSITLAGTDSTVMTFPSTSATIARTEAAQTFTGSQTFSANIRATQGIQTNATGGNGNLYVENGLSLSGTVSTAAYLTNSNNIQMRVGIRGSTSTVATAGNNVFALAIGDNTYTEATSGTSALAGGLYIKTQSFTAGSGATTDFQNAYFGDAPSSTATNNWSINAGASQFRGKVTLGAPVNLKAYTVATLPAGVQGDGAYVTDALAPAFLTAVIGGGAVVTPVFYNGAAWVAF